MKIEMKNKPVFIGAGIAIVTPFKEDLSIHYEMFEKHIDFLIENKADALVVAGTTGESATLSKEEKIELVKVAKSRVKGKIPIIAGSGSNCTKSTIELSKEFEKIDVDNLMVVTPYYNKATQKGLINHYTEIANAVNTPIMLYNVPGRTAVNMEAATVAQLANHENITSIKEASGDFTQIAEIAYRTKNVDNFYIFAGNDDQMLSMKALGSVGTVSVAGNIMPEIIHKLFTSDDVDNQSLELQFKILELSRVLFSELSPSPIKAALTQIGLSTEYLRPPLYPMENKEELIKVMKGLGII